MTDDKTPKTMPLPLVVQLGFAGSRQLFDAIQHPGINAATFEAEIETWLAERLQEVRQDLGLEPRHFFCGISSLAIGADTVFCKACQRNQIPVRVFLPQTRDEFLNAAGSTGPDFPSQTLKDQAVLVLDSQNVIQERLVSDASKRPDRFEDVNREIVRVSDVLVCLMREGAQGTVGGTEGLINRAVQRGKLVLVITVGVTNGKAHFAEEWRLPKQKEHDPRDGSTPAKAFEFRLPREARTVAGLRLSEPAPDKVTPVEHYATVIKRLSSDTAAKKQSRFKLMAKTIVGAHIVATILAALALGFARVHMLIIPILLALELAMLAVGLWVHDRLHKTKTSHAWAEARLLAEVTRSVLAVGNLHLYLEHLFSLPFPAAIRPLLRTLNVLQLQSTRQDHAPWEQKRDRYVEKRLTIPRFGQIDFYSRRARESETLFKWFHVAFFVFWVVASLSTAMKLVMHSYLESHLGYEELLTGIMGTLAIVMPVLAVAALSLAAAMDLEAQEHTYREMLVFLEAQKECLNSARSERDYARLVIETEYQLLGETANWFSRRSYTNVA